MPDTRKRGSRALQKRNTFFVMSAKWQLFRLHYTVIKEQKMETNRESIIDDESYEQQTH